MEIKSEDIRLFAKLGFLLYADSYTSKIAGMKPGKDAKDRDVWDFILDPSDELIKRYNLKVNSNGDMLYTQQIPCDLVLCLNPDPAWTRWLSLTTYDGKTTAEMEKLKGLSQQEEIIRLKQKIKELSKRVEVADEKLFQMETNMPKYLERNFKPMLEQITPMMEKILKKNE